MSKDPHAALRKEIAELLANGLETEVEPFPETEKEFLQLTAQLKTLDPADLKGKLVLGGFLDHPYGEDKMRCFECIYYLRNRKLCDLPELALPVEAEWYCRLWRV